MALLYPGSIAPYAANCIVGYARLNMGLTRDQAIPISFPGGGSYRVNQIMVTNQQGDVTAAVGGVFSDVNKGGITLVAATQVYSQLATATHNVVGSILPLTLTTDSVTAALDVKELYLHLDTGATSGVFADFYVSALIQPNFVTGGSLQP